jgi:hypothetical protein
MRTPRSALITHVTRHRRLYNHRLAGGKGCYRRTDLDDDGRTFMPNLIRVLNDLTANPSGFIIMHIAAANPDIFNLQ